MFAHTHTAKCMPRSAGEKALNVASQCAVLGTCAALLYAVYRLHLLQERLNSTLKKTKRPITNISSTVSTVMSALSMVGMFYRDVWGGGNKSKRRRSRARRVRAHPQSPWLDVGPHGFPPARKEKEHNCCETSDATGGTEWSDSN